MYRGLHIGVRICAKQFFQAEDGIRDLRMSRGLGDVYKRQAEAEREVAVVCFILFSLSRLALMLFSARQDHFDENLGLT